jgi:hypothetical protein
MASLTDLGYIAQDGHFQHRVNLAAVNAALAVMAELATVPSHALRITFAKSILSGSTNMLFLSYGILENSTISAEATITVNPDFSIPDADIQFAMNSIFNAYAGVAN